jgi:hypothetical protein
MKPVYSWEVTEVKLWQRLCYVFTNYMMFEITPVDDIEATHFDLTIFFKREVR